MKLKDKIKGYANDIFAKHGTTWEGLTSSEIVFMTEAQALALSELAYKSILTDCYFIEAYLGIPHRRTKAAIFRTNNQRKAA